MVRGKDFPDEGELVVGTVRSVENFGAFVKLEEYPDKEGFLHIAEVSAGWVKRIRDFVREQQRVVCKVLNVDTGRGHVDLSLKRVNEHQKREKIQEWKNDQKAEKLLEIVSTQIKKTADESWKDFGAKLADKYGTLYAAFEEAANDVAVLKEDGFKGKWLEAFAEVAKDNIQIPFVDVKGYLEMTCSKPDGIVHIRSALAEALKGEFEDVGIIIKYVGAPHYLIKVRAPDFKIGEQELEKSADRALKAIGKQGGGGSFKKQLEAAAA
ncbi:MAG TPA: translation initiation factor IF-2 subunit alpha [Candidatus Thermoplasmatota archaeon]|nr:translation initiation factor IF-2 subunit alpha [Candidatus Thermoplasmatota archaeon]